MFEGINFKQFLNDYKEFHALVNGLFEVLCPWKPRCEISTSALLEIEGSDTQPGEWHYYQFGRALGVFAWIGIIIGIAKAVF